MLSKAKIKAIHALEWKKFRREQNAFVAEGPKVVGDLLPYFSCRLLVATPKWLNRQNTLEADEAIEVTDEELANASFLKTPQEVLAVFSLPQYTADFLTPAHELCLALDDVQDPGNLGTIIRLAEWFGIRQIYCSTGTADAFSPKVVQATMGAIARVQVHYLPLADFFATLQHHCPQTPIYGTFLDGKNIYKEPLSEKGVILMGNEGNGIGKALETCVTHRLYIPSFTPDECGSESLNVAIATAITCSEFRRRQ